MNTDCDRRMQIELREKIDLKKRNSGLEAENAQLRAELIDSEKQRAWLQNELVKMSSSEGNLRVQLHEVSEIYTGSDGFIPETAPEAYCLRVMEQMYQAALTEGEK